MKKLMALCLALLLCLAGALPALASLEDEIALNMTRDQVLALMTQEGVTATYASNDTLYIDTPELYLNLSFDPTAQTVTWIDLCMPGEGQIACDLTVPDWSLKLDDLLRDLREHHAGYDLFCSAGDNSVFFVATLFGLQAEVQARFDDNGSLYAVQVEEYDGQSALPWAAHMGSVMGEPDEAYGLLDRVEGGSFSVTDGVLWVRSGNQYALDNKIMTYSFADGDAISTVWENRLNIMIVPMP